MPGRERDRLQGGEIQLRDSGAELGVDGVEALLAELGQVDLVHRQHDVAYAHQAGDERVPLGLHQHALARVHQHDRELRIGGAGGHVAGILLVARRVGHDEAAARRAEEAVGDVDGDALLALRLQPVDQQ